MYFENFILRTPWGKETVLICCTQQTLSSKSRRESVTKYKAQTFHNQHSSISSIDQEQKTVFCHLLLIRINNTI